jgi:hypothetical protein
MGQLNSPGFDVAAPGTGMGFLDQTAERRVDPPNIGRAVGVDQLFSMPIHLGPTLGTPQFGPCFHVPLN